MNTRSGNPLNGSAHQLTPRAAVAGDHRTPPNYIEGYEAVLLRSDLKAKLKGVRDNMGMTALGLERVPAVPADRLQHAVSAVVDLFTSRPEFDPELMDYIERAMQRDAELQSQQLRKNMRVDGRDPRRTNGHAAR